MVSGIGHGPKACLQAFREAGAVGIAVLDLANPGRVPEGRRVGPSRTGLPAIISQPQEVAKNLLEPIWENDFADESIGYRPERSPRHATQELGETLDDGKHRWVVEADIRRFFDHINHGWLIRMLETRIADRALIRIIREWLKAGVMEELSHWSPSSEGTPQGGVISPLLGNIYLHCVQDLWIKRVVAKKRVLR